MKCYVDVTVFQMEGEELGLTYGIDNTTKGKREGYEVGEEVVFWLGSKRGSDDEKWQSDRLEEILCNSEVTFLEQGCGGLLGWVLGTSIRYLHGSTLVET